VRYWSRTGRRSARRSPRSPPLRLHPHRLGQRFSPLSQARGIPSAAEALLFLDGAVAAYALVTAVALRVRRAAGTGTNGHCGVSWSSPVCRRSDHRCGLGHRAPGPQRGGLALGALFATALCLI